MDKIIVYSNFALWIDKLNAINIYKNSLRKNGIKILVFLNNSSCKIIY